MGPTGDRTTATAKASSDPATVATSTPARASATVMAGEDPSERRTARSAEPIRSWRRMAWAPMISAATPARMPNTSRAMASGRRVRWARATWTEVGVEPVAELNPFGVSRVASAVTLDTVAAPPRTCSATPENVA
jgi:hypothetical protein